MPSILSGAQQNPSYRIIGILKTHTHTHQLTILISDISLDAKAAEVASMLSGARQDSDYDQTSEGSSVLVPSGIKRKAKSQSTEPLSLKAQDFQV